MDAELKQKWVDALRSGEYQQGHGFFEYRGKYCCLGVLCAVAGQPMTHMGLTAGNWPFTDEAIGEPASIRLAGMNDNGRSFPEIADYIEKNL